MGEERQSERARAIQTLLSEEVPEVVWRVRALSADELRPMSEKFSRASGFFVTVDNRVSRAIADMDNGALRRLAHELRLAARMGKDET